MHILWKLVLSIMPASLVALHLLPFVECSSHEHNTTTHKNIKHNTNKMNPHVIFEIKLHGILSWASMGFLMPLGILIIRMVNKDECGHKKLKAVFYFHAILQILVVLLATAGAILSIKSFENMFNNSHQKIGLVLYGAVWVQALAGLGRRKRGTKGRSIWYFFHWILGTMISLVSILNIYTGLKAYHKRTSRSIRLWSILFTAEVCFMAFFYLFQDKWGYMQKQGVILGNEQITLSDHVLPPHGDSQKEVLNEPCRKSNSLGNYFVKTNALKKLFQVT